MHSGQHRRTKSQSSGQPRRRLMSSSVGAGICNFIMSAFVAYLRRCVVTSQIINIWIGYAFIGSCCSAEFFATANLVRRVPNHLQTDSPLYFGTQPNMNSTLCMLQRPEIKKMLEVDIYQWMRISNAIVELTAV